MARATAERLEYVVPCQHVGAFEPAEHFVLRRGECTHCLLRRLHTGGGVAVCHHSSSPPSSTKVERRDGLSRTSGLRRLRGWACKTRWCAITDFAISR